MLSLLIWIPKRPLIQNVFVQGRPKFDHILNVPVSDKMWLWFQFLILELVTVLPTAKHIWTTSGGDLRPGALESAMGTGYF